MYNKLVVWIIKDTHTRVHCFGLVDINTGYRCLEHASLNSTIFKMKWDQVSSSWHWVLSNLLDTTATMQVIHLFLLGVNQPLSHVRPCGLTSYAGPAVVSCVVFLQLFLGNFNQASSEPSQIFSTLGKPNPVHQTVAGLQGHLVGQGQSHVTEDKLALSTC